MTITDGKDMPRNQQKSPRRETPRTRPSLQVEPNRRILGSIGQVTYATTKNQRKTIQSTN